MQRWLKADHGHIAEDFEQMLATPMGRAVASTLLNLAIELMGSEVYQRAEILHRARDAAQDDAFRRTAVGFCLPDLITNAMAFREALQETLFNHINPGSAEELEAFREGMMTLNRFGDVLIAGEVSGYFAYQYRDEDEGFRPV